MLPFLCEELIEKITEIIILLLKMRETVSLVCSFCFCFFFLPSVMFCFYIQLCAII